MDIVSLRSEGPVAIRETVPANFDFERRLLRENRTLDLETPRV